MLDTLHRFPIRPLPFYGRMRRFKRDDGETDFEVELVWSKFAVVKFLLLPEDERREALNPWPRSSYTYRPPQPEFRNRTPLRPVPEVARPMGSQQLISDEDDTHRFKSVASGVCCA